MSTFFTIKELHMRLMIYLGLIFMTPSLWAGEIIDSSSKDLSHGFRKVRTTEKISAISSETEQFVYLYYKAKKLGQINKYSISPSGDYAIFQDSITGNIFLFNSGNGILERQKLVKIAPVRKFLWNEGLEYVDVRFIGKVSSISIPFE